MAQTLVKDCEQTVNNLTNTGSIYTKMSDYENAMKSFNEALSIAQKAKSDKLSSEVYIRMGYLYFKQKKYNPAIECTRKTLELTEKVAYAELQKDANKQLADIYSATGQYKKAYLNHVCFHTLNDSIFNNKNIKEIALFESSHKFAKEKDVYELEKVSHQLKIKNQRLVISLLIVISSLILLLTVAIYW
ncbi:tetratricopeptide repeat protein [Phocaeicola sartorii]|uniref:tetratricopeptide repeat protein n=1 Tax=Phocaeicola sartorii TaxID=671267 RepID=UPI002431E53B|nr:tetratricopeptide repeat protein [Phocaeicola sartorii]